MKPSAVRALCLIGKNVSGRADRDHRVQTLGEKVPSSRVCLAGSGTLNKDLAVARDQPDRERKALKQGRFH